jgi:acyl-CoA thioesterase-2
VEEEIWDLDMKIEAQAELIETVSARPTGTDRAVGDVPDWFGPVAFGGFILGQTLFAATTTVDATAGLRPHSLHNYFLRPVMAGIPVEYEMTRVRDGRSYTTRRVDAYQSEKLVTTMTVSFTSDTDGYEYELPVLDELPEIDSLDEWSGQGPWLERVAGPTEPAADGTRRSTHRAYFKLPARMTDDPMLHASIVAWISDMTFTGARPLNLEPVMDGIVSLDHALWFHRAMRADEWMYYDLHSLVNAGGRGMIRGTLHTEKGRLCASVAQELLLRVV